MACRIYVLSLTFITTLTSMCYISGFLAVVENLAVLLAVRYIHSLRPTARYFMASLAAAELLSGLTANVYFILNYSRKEEIFLRTESSLWCFTTTSVTFSLSNVAVDRYIAITSPLRYHERMTSTRCLMMIIFSWSVAFLGLSVTYIVPVKNLVQIWICAGIISVFIPFCIIAFCYSRIYKATRSTFPVRENITDAQQMAENRRQRKTACTFGIITGLYIVFFMPSFLVSVMLVTANDVKVAQVKCDGVGRKVWLSVAAISYLSAVCDPWVYVIRMPDFRTALKELFQRLRRILPFS